MIIAPGKNASIQLPHQAFATRGSVSPQSFHRRAFSAFQFLCAPLTNRIIARRYVGPPPQIPLSPRFGSDFLDLFGRYGMSTGRHGRSDMREPSMNPREIDRLRAKLRSSDIIVAASFRSCRPKLRRSTISIAGKSTFQKCSGSAELRTESRIDFSHPFSNAR